MNLWLKSCPWGGWAGNHAPGGYFYGSFIRKLSKGKYWWDFLMVYLFVPGHLEQETLKTAWWDMPLKPELHFLNISLRNGQCPVIHPPRGESYVCFISEWLRWMAVRGVNFFLARWFEWMHCLWCRLGKPGTIYQTDTSWQMWGVSMVSEAVNSGKYFCCLGPSSQDLAWIGFQSL